MSESATCCKDANRVILVWRFEDAPSRYRELSGHGGDEDWVVFVPDSLRDAYVPFVEGCGYGTIGVCDISHHPVEGGTVYIGAHA